MANPWFPSGSASAFIPPLATAGDSQDPPPLPPDPPDPANPLSLSSFPLLSSSPSPKSARLSLRTAPRGPVVLASDSSTGVAAPALPFSTPQTGSTVPKSGSGFTVATVASEPLNTPSPSTTPPSLPSISTANSILPPLLSLPKIKPVVPIPPNLPLPAQTLTSQNPPAPSIKTTAPTPVGSSLVERLRKSVDKTLSRLAPVSLSESGRPRILIPDSVFQKGAEMHKDFIMCHFNGRPPPFKQIQSVINHLWGKGKRVEIHFNPIARSMLVRIPSDYLRLKILEKNVWYVGDSMFSASQWSSSSARSAPRETIQIWAHLTGVPLDLRYQQGLSLVAGLIGEPKETDDFTLNLVSLTLSHVKVEVKLSEPLPKVVEFVRQSGEVVEVQVDYPWVPPTCAHCKELGHIAKNCLLLPAPSKDTSKSAPKPAQTKPTAPQYVAKPLQKVSPTVAKNSLVVSGSVSNQTIVPSPVAAPLPPASKPYSSSLTASLPPNIHLSSLNSPPIAIVTDSPGTSFSPLPSPSLSQNCNPVLSQKTLLKRSISNPNLQSFPSFMSQLAYFSSLPSIFPIPPLKPLNSPTPSTLPPLSSLTSVDFPVSSGALHLEEPHTH
ncbi:hypothetical protein N665_0129s0058 [Sinapis alba]|nr:hypothetical protein N665_0129s0058 [Sinapis alba]